MTDEDFESMIIAILLFGGAALACVASFALIGVWWSLLWIGLIMVVIGIRAL